MFYSTCLAVEGAWALGLKLFLAEAAETEQDLGELYALIPDLGCSLKLPYFQIGFEVLDQPPVVGT